MPVYNGNIKQKELYFGNVKIKEAYYGSTKIYSAGYPTGTVIFESSTPGTYTVKLDYSQKYEIWLVGAGGKGAKATSSGVLSKMAYAAGGGSGAYVHGTLTVSSGSYSVVVGSANGGQSSAFNNIARGGGNGSASSSSSSGGSGGTYSVTSGISGVNGNSGESGRDRLYCEKSGGASKYGGYGKGGNARAAIKGTEYANNGTNGYVKIVAVQS